jgi:hypothetical protein
LKNGKATTSGPTSSLYKSHLVPAASVVVDNRKRQLHAEKLISPDLKTGDKTKLRVLRSADQLSM